MNTVKEIKRNLHLEQVHSKLLYLEASNNYTILHFSNGKKEISGYTLLVFQKLLQGMPLFKRIHRSHIVNMKYVKKVKPKESLVSLRDGTHLRISRRSMTLVEKQ
ncbi:LytTR family transcriptional regulator [Lacihabitans sp. LS3-19]|uniref:LytR/AlgR family response regulator transcription factor n=1 Tax=Lacihabitans sp. LS3-19 TaxID=2487335 RepID=UPI0020CE9B68|nr:LytTR family DNA-binding domain-containing protein [Lacihabitans sp. LS3-19]MCP9767159.1 LytTR family transcriptional regulator [Lacihabitans sp. LS3-19]